MKLSLMLVTGNEAEDLLRDGAFLQAWRELAQRDSKTTLIQEAPFVCTWYEQYADLYAPLLCLGYGEGDALLGLMPLAQHKQDGTLVHAGGEQAEYHGWIADREVDEEFLIACLIQLQRQFELKSWVWRWLPPGTPMTWVRSSKLRQAGIYVVCRKQLSPVLALREGDKRNKITRNKSIKSKINRYRRRADFRLERIVSAARALELLPVLEKQCDFRQKAVNGVTPFGSDHNKFGFFAGRMEYPQSNHFTALLLDDKPIAFHFGACDGERVLLGLSAYDPVEGGNSPGTVLLTELIKMLDEEGFRYFDLTPGEDAYKERFANLHQPLYMPTFVHSRTDKLRLQIRETIRAVVKYLIRRFDVGEKQVDQWREVFNDPLSLLRVKTLKSLIDEPTLDDPPVAQIYCLRAERLEQTRGTNVAVATQRYQDLLDHASPEDHSAVLAAAMQRFAAGDVFYSITRDGVLQQSLWLKKVNARNAANKRVNPHELPANSLLLYGAYTHAVANSQSPFTELIGRAAGENLDAEHTSIFAAVDADMSTFRAALEKMGFTPPVDNAKRATAEPQSGKAS